MKKVRDLRKLDYTGRRAYHKLRGVLPEGFRVINKRQTKRFKQAQRVISRRAGAKHKCVFRRVDSGDQKGGHPILVQLHRNEQVLNPIESRMYEHTMQRAGYPYKR